MAVRKVHKPTEVVHCMKWSTKPNGDLDMNMLCGMGWESIPPGHQYIHQDSAGEHLITCSGCRAEMARLALEASGEH